LASEFAAFFSCIKLMTAASRDNGHPFVPFSRVAMKIRHSIIALLVAGFACGLQAQDGKPAATKPKLASGLMMKQGDKLIFAPCRDRSYATVDDISPAGMLSAALDSVGLTAGKKLYVELFAVVEGGMLRASGLNLARSEGRCQQPGGNEESWRATGNEPGWLLAIGPEVVVLKQLGKADINVPGGAPAGDGNGFRFAAKTEAAQLNARFEPKVCRDTMADTVFGWTATLEVNGQTLKGCAWQR
jgi:putative lipoprotein